jgi:hypothetical protein
MLSACGQKPARNRYQYGLQYNLKVLLSSSPLSLSADLCSFHQSYKFTFPVPYPPRSYDPDEIYLWYLGSHSAGDTLISPLLQWSPIGLSSGRMENWSIWLIISWYFNKCSGFINISYRSGILNYGPGSGTPTNYGSGSYLDLFPAIEKISCQIGTKYWTFFWNFFESSIKQYR